MAMRGSFPVQYANPAMLPALIPAPTEAIANAATGAANSAATPMIISTFSGKTFSIRILKKSSLATWPYKLASADSCSLEVEAFLNATKSWDASGMLFSASNIPITNLMSLPPAKSSPPKMISIDGRTRYLTAVKLYATPASKVLTPGGIFWTVGVLNPGPTIQYSKCSTPDAAEESTVSTTRVGVPVVPVRSDPRLAPSIPAIGF